MNLLGFWNKRRTLYDLDKLETRINEETGDVLIFRNILRRDTHMKRSEMTIANLEDENDKAEYYIDRISGHTIHTLFERYKERFKGYKGYSLRDALYYYTGEEYPKDKSFSYNDLIKLKGTIKEHLRDDRIGSLYCLKGKKGNNSNESQKARMVYRDTQRIGDSKDVEDRLIDIESQQHIGSVNRRYYEDFLETAEKVFDIEEICPPGYTRGYSTERFYTRDAVNLIIKKYKDKHPELFGKTISYAASNSGDCFPKVPTPTISLEALKTEKGRKGSQDLTYPGEE